MIKDVSIELIQKCVNHCIHCSSCSTEESVAMLDIDTMRRVIRTLQGLKVERVCLSGGEPFLHPNLLEIVRQLVGCGMTVDVYSSGILKEEGAPEPLSLERLSLMKDAGLRSLLFNVQSVDDPTYDRITQSKGHFPLLQMSIANAIACGIRTEIHFVPMRQNVHEAEAVIRFAERTGIEQVNFLKLVPHGRAQENAQSLMLSDEELAALCSRLEDLQTQGKSIRLGLPLSIQGNTPPCHAVRKKLYIKFDGSVFGCEAFKYIQFQDENGSPVLPSNILEKDIEEIYYNSEYLQRSLKLVEHYEACKIGCENCPVQKYLKDGELSK
ncbi:radical SAM protein [Bilophila wadsworthia]|jgi:MoaA/NifB/PqqE/SkfB family radical SAM enzyme|uniref:radical SAM protein n=1 Tax=Bilophila wadsworthia TaxID=35833 RepID=UPI00242B3EE5|nr:radical SAM protein [Bilophila wadsworthia]